MQTTEAQAANNAIQQVEDNNSPDPFEEAYQDALNLLSVLPQKVTSDTIFPDLDKYNFTDGRVVGSLMRKLITNKVITLTAKYRPSERPGNHGAPRRVYNNTKTFCLS